MDLDFQENRYRGVDGSPIRIWYFARETAQVSPLNLLVFSEMAMSFELGMRSFISISFETNIKFG